MALALCPLSVGEFEIYKPESDSWIDYILGILC